MKAGRVLQGELGMRKLSQERFAAMCGVTMATINNIINEKRDNVTIKTASRIMAQSHFVAPHDWFTE